MDSLHAVPEGEETLRRPSRRFVRREVSPVDQEEDEVGLKCVQRRALIQDLLLVRAELPDKKLGPDTVPEQILRQNRPQQAHGA